jgi:predicted alpha/beta hydrolase family esterase
MSQEPTHRRWTTGCLAKIPSTPEGDQEYADVLATVPRTTFPQRLADFGYEYNAEGRLVQQSNQKPFAWLGQRHYDFLGDAIVNDIYAIMESKYGLQRQMQPSYTVKGSGQVPIFVSPNLGTAETVVLLCQGSGAVRPGMWARALCVNNSLNDGAIFKYLEDIQRRGWAVVVANPNENAVVPAPPPERQRHGLSEDEACQFWLGTSDMDWKREARASKDEAVRVPGSESPMDHVCSLWEEVIRPANPKQVLVIAHSFGGRCTTSLIEAFYPEVEALVPAIAWTDAINDMFKGGAMFAPSKASGAQLRKMRELVMTRSRNWVASDAPLDTKLQGFMPSRDKLACQEVSAGHDTHEWTSAACRTSVFAFLDERLAAWQQQARPAQSSKTSGL